MTLVLNDRYELLRLLGGGGMGSVYLAHDLRETGRLLALKSLLPGADESTAAPFLIREFSFLTALSHPYILQIHDFARVRHVVGEPEEGEPDEAPDIGTPFFTREFVAGAPLPSLLHRLSIEVRQRLMLELAATIAYLHRQGVFHRDLKPDNVLISTSSDAVRIPHVKLMDFGLAAYMSEAEGVVGNPRYLSPELLTGEPMTVKAEVYSLGLIFFEVFAERPAFEGETAADIARSREHHFPPALPSHLPSSLTQLIVSMLDRQPEKRPTLETVMSVLSVLVSAEGGSSSNLGHQGASRLAGRETELKLLKDLVDGLQRGDATRRPPRALLLTGPPGIGKSRLVQAVVAHAQLANLRTLVVTCLPESEAFTCVRALIQPLLQERPDLITAERELLPTVLGGRSQPSRQRTTLDLSPLQLLRRLREAFLAFLEALSQEQKLVIVVEDMQWIDPESLELLRHILLHFPPTQAVLVATSWPSGQEDAPIDRLTNELSHGDDSVIWHELEGLEASAVQLMIERTLGPIDNAARLSEQLRNQTEGNPLFIEEILKLLGPHDTLEQLLSKSHLPRAVSDAFGQQLKALGHDARQALKGLAVCGSAASSTDIIEITRQQRSECLQGLEEALACQLIREQGNGYWFWHSTMVQLVERLMTGEETREFHRRAGQRRELHSERNDLERIGRLVVHFTLANEPNKALGYALAGARMAADTFMVRRAIELYERARELSLEVLGRNLGGMAGLIEIRERLATLYVSTGDLQKAEVEAKSLLFDPWLEGDRRARSRLNSLLGDIAMRKGEHEEALSFFQTALDESTEVRTAAEILDQMAECHIRRSSPEEALRCCDLARERLGRMAANDLRGSIAFHRGRCAQLKGQYHEALALLTEARTLQEQARNPRPLAQTLTATATVYNYLDQYGQARDRLLEALQMQEQAGDLESVASTLDRLALSSLGLSDYQASITYGRRSIEAWRRVGNPQGEARATNTLAIAYHSRGIYREALSTAEQALRLYRRLDDKNGIATTSLNLGILNMEIGGLPQARELLAVTLELARSTGNALRTARCHHILGVVEMQHGDLERAREHLSQAHTGLTQLGNKELLADMLCSLSELDLKEGEVSKALTHALEARELVQTHRFANRLQTELALARAQLANPQGDIRPLQSQFEGIPSEELEALSPDQLWQFWEVRGRIALRLGRPTEAIRQLTRSMEVMKACFSQLPDAYRALYLSDPRRMAIRSALEQTLRQAQNR